MYIGDFHVGYLSKMDAARYAPMFDALNGVSFVTGKMLDSSEKYPRIEFELPHDVYYSDFKKDD